MADYEIFAPTGPAMLALAQSVPGLWRAAQQVGRITIPAGIAVSGKDWSIYYYGKKMVPTGNTVTDPFGNQVPEMAPAPGVYASLRWTRTANPPTPPAGSGVTINPLPAASARFL